MIRLFYFLSLVIILSCSNSGYKPEKSLQHNKNLNDSTIKSILDIGGCYAYQLNKDSVFGVLLSSISKDEDETYYSFSLSGTVFDHIPSKSEFQSGGLWGLKVPFGNFSTFDTTFCQYFITEKDLLPDLKKITLIEKINPSIKNRVGSSGGLRKLDELIQQIDYFHFHNKKINKEKSILPEQPYEVFSWDKLIVTNNPEEISKPVIVWRLNRRTANPEAAKLMAEDWFWSEIDDLSPFGNDDGSDAFYLFKDWRESNQIAEPSLFINELENRWQMSFAHKDITSESELQEVEKKNPFYRNTDRAIIAIALGEIALEGRISSELKELGIKAIKRTRTEFGMNGIFTKEYKIEYKKRLDKIEIILNKF